MGPKVEKWEERSEEVVMKARLRMKRRPVERMSASST